MYDLTKSVKPLLSDFFFFFFFQPVGFNLPLLRLLWRQKCFRYITDILSQYKQRFYLHTWTNIQLFSLQCWSKIQKSDNENSSINQHEGVILIWHQILSNTLQKFIADGGETYESHLSSQRVNAMKYSSKSEFEPNYDLFKQLLSWSFCQIFSLSKFCGTKSNIK